MKIPIVMVCDQNYISQTRVTIWTMRKSTDEDVFFEITILCSDKLAEKDKRRLKELDNILKNMRIVFFIVKDEVFQNSKVSGHIPVTSYYRLIIPDVIKESKCLFLDGDMIIKVDLCTLYLCELNDCYIAGVRDMGFLFRPEDAIKHAELYEFNSIENYINAGVLVFNLDKIREDHIQELFLQNLDKHYQCMDQDILNKVCEGKIMHLDLKYNLMCGYGKKMISDGIIHFAGKYKPWNNYRIQWAKEWWNWAKEALEEKEYDELYYQAIKITEQGDWSYIEKRCLEERVVIIIGYSNIGVALGQALKRGNCHTTFFYCDNSKEKQKFSNESIKIYSVKELAEKYQDALWINTSQLSYTGINMQLMELGINEDRIIIYKDKSMVYFEALEDEFVEHELHQMQLRVMRRT